MVSTGLVATCVCVCVLFEFSMLCAEAFLIGFTDRPPLVAICLRFLFFSPFDAMCIGSRIGFTDMPALIVICVGFLFSFVFLML